MAYVVGVLKRYTSDEAKFKSFLAKVMLKVKEGQPFDSLGGVIISEKDLFVALDQIRGFCEFPIVPAPLVSHGPTSFHQDLETIAKGNGLVDPLAVSFNIVYARLPSKVYTVIKVSGFLGLVLRQGFSWTCVVLLN